MKKMQWFNEPDQWELINDTSLSMFVTPFTDFWRKTHYGFTVDDGPFCYLNVGGEFEANVKISGHYKSRYDQMGLMIRKDEKNWIKTGVEFVDEKINLSAVVTLKRSDWSIVTLEEKPTAVWLKVLRRGDSIKIMYALNGKDYSMIRLAYFPENTPVMVGLTAASPDGEGFQALFDNFEVIHLPDARRLKWLEEN
jgi:regulation of enolase protein 1 (concanavalin A-like superfamily)